MKWRFMGCFVTYKNLAVYNLNMYIYIYGGNGCNGIFDVHNQQYDAWVWFKTGTLLSINLINIH